jgi:hypothetical protein
MKEFTTKKNPREFKLDGVVIRAIPKIPTLTLKELGERFEKFQGITAMKAEEFIEVTTSIIKEVLFDESYEHIQGRLNNKEDAFDYTDLIPILMHLLGDAYGLRPTEKSQSSEDGQETIGESSTGGVPPKDLIL